MVPHADNDTINTTFRSDYSKITPAEALIEILRHHDEIISDIRKDQIDVNEFLDDPASGTLTIENPNRSPILITDIFATWAIPSQVSFAKSASTLDPAALQSIVSQLYGTGEWTLNWTVGLYGTVTAADANNMQISGFGAGTIQAIYPGVAGTYPQAPITFFQNGGTINIQAIAAASGISAGYSASFTLSPVGNANGTAKITFGGRTFQLNYASGLFELTSVHGMRMDNTSNNNITLTVTPAAAVHLEICGTADYRKIERA